MNTEKLKKNIMFIFTFYFPVGILVYYFENFYLICIDPQHRPLQHYAHSFPMGDFGISFGFFFLFFFVNWLLKVFGKIKNKILVSFIISLFFSILCFLLELIVGIFYLDVFNYQLWDYTMYTYNYRGVIALEIYLLWFFLGFFYALFCFKYVLKFKKLFDETIYEKLMKKKILLVIISLVWIIYIGDIFYNWYQMYFWEKDLGNKGIKYNPWHKYAEVVHNYKNLK